MGFWATRVALMGALLAAMLLNACSKTSTPPTQPAATSGSVPSASSRAPMPAAQGSELPDPTVPLPRAAAMPTGSLDETAAGLAQQVLAGGDRALPALLTAFQASGIAVRDANDAMVLDPARPWSGMLYESWELQALAGSVQPGRTASIALLDLDDVLRVAMPDAGSGPLARLLLDGVRSHAQDQPSPSRFWARFIVELGRQSPDVARYDLLGQVDPANVHLSILQVSLLLRRLITDVSIAAGPQTSRALKRLPAWLEAEPAYADQLPCTLDKTERNILDFVALGSKYGLGGVKIGDYGFDGLIKNAGLTQYKQVTSIAGVLLAYAKFVYIYMALETDITMDTPGPPLKRTKQMAPRSGEQRGLTAITKLNIGKGQMANCFRIMLNAAGLDFNLPNDGPLKDARVAWVGETGFSESAEAVGGPAQIVRFVGTEQSRIQSGGDVSQGFNVVTNQVTDSRGMTRVSVEGTGQKKEIRDDAKQIVTKSASLRVDVAVKGSDLFKDFGEAAKSATGGAKALLTLPLEMLYRAKWASAGHLSFDVLDWGFITAKWTGNITVTSKNEYAGGPGAKLAETWTTTAHFTTQGGTWTGTATLTRTNGCSDSTGQASGKGNAVLVVIDMTGATPLQFAPEDLPQAQTVVARLMFMPDGSYLVSLNPAPLTGSETSVQKAACRGKYETGPTTSTTAWNVNTLTAADGKGMIDPKNPYTLADAKTEPLSSGTGSTTIVWKLTRVQVDESGK